MARTWRRLLNRSFLSLQAMALSSRGRQSREEGRSSHVPHTKATHSLIIIMAAAGCPMSVALGLSGVSRRSVGQSPPSLSLSEPVGRSVHWNKPAAGEGTLAQTLTCFLPCDQQWTKPHHPSSVLCSRIKQKKSAYRSVRCCRRDRFQSGQSMDGQPVTADNLLAVRVMNDF